MNNKMLYLWEKHTVLNCIKRVYSNILTDNCEFTSNQLATLLQKNGFVRWYSASCEANLSKQLSNLVMDGKLSVVNKSVNSETSLYEKDKKGWKTVAFYKLID